MGDSENIPQASKKRAAGREISRDNPGLDDKEETCEVELGTFKKASEEVLASRRIVKVRRSQATAASSTASSNPFALLKLVPSLNSSGPNIVATNEAERQNSLTEDEVKVDATIEIDGQSSSSKTQLEGEAISNKDAKVVVVGKAKDGANNDVEPETIEKDVNNDAEVVVVGKAKDEANNDVEPETIEKDVNNDAEVFVVGKAKDEANNDVEPETIEKDVKKDAEVHAAENEEEQTDENEKVEKTGDATHFSSFQQLSSSQNAFSGLVGTGMSGSSFLFGSLVKDGSSPAPSSSSLFGMKNDSSSFGIGLSSNGSDPSSGPSGVSVSAKTEATAFPSLQEVSVETGEENEKSVFAADSVLYDFLEGTWKERGKGELKVNVSTSGTGKARLIMRTRGNYRLILNASVYSDMKLTNMDKRGVTFACMNSADEGKDGLSTYAVKFKDISMIEKFRSCVMENKDKIAVAPLKTPENSPKASDD